MNPNNNQFDLADTIRQAIKQELSEQLSQAFAKPYLTRDELQALTGWSIRTIQYLRSTRQIPFTQHGRKILYPTAGIREFLKSNELSAKKGA
jgi:hypothetical protein